LDINPAHLTEFIKQSAQTNKQAQEALRDRWSTDEHASHELAGHGHEETGREPMRYKYAVDGALHQPPYAGHSHITLRP
jgi:hypothetical protein